LTVSKIGLFVARHLVSNEDFGGLCTACHSA
jgi:hypothetical protein